MKLSMQDALFSAGDKKRNVFFISDTHFFHTNIIKEDYCGRPFKDIQEMNNYMIAGWNEKVGKDDIVIHLGDIAMRGWAGFSDSVENLNGLILLVKGNHDPDNLSYILDKETDAYREMIRTLVAIKYNIPESTLDKHGIQYSTSQGMLAIGEMIDRFRKGWSLPMPPAHSCKVIATDYLELKAFGISSQPVVCSHYPFESWKGSSKGDKASVHLHGHCHGRLTLGRFNRLDVSCDNIYRLFPKMGKEAFLPLTTKELMKALDESNNRII